VGDVLGAGMVHRWWCRGGPKDGDGDVGKCQWGLMAKKGLLFACDLHRSQLAFRGVP